MDTSKGGSHLGAMTDLKKLVYISRACLRLLKIYVTEIYPDGGKVFSCGNSLNEGDMKEMYSYLDDMGWGLEAV